MRSTKIKILTAREAKMLPTEMKLWQLPHCTVQFKLNYSADLGRGLPELRVMSMDQYNYQREYTLKLRRRSDANEYIWESHAYRHPGRRQICEVTEGKAIRFMLAFIDLCDRHPSLLFNKTGDHVTYMARPRHEGWVHIHERLLDGAEPTARLLK